MHRVWVMCAFVSAVGSLDFGPSQVHLSFGDRVNDIVVTWSTVDEVPDGSYVQFGDNLELNVTSYVTKFVDGGAEKRVQFIHRAKLTDLLFGTQYFYRCGSPGNWSQIFSFTTAPAGDTWAPRLAIIGDLGLQNGVSLPDLMKEAASGSLDAALHLGDFAYDLQTDGGRLGDQFMNQLQPVAANIPYLTCPGNHDTAYNFSHYLNRFSMPGNPSDMYYSIQLGPVHLISVNVESYYYMESGLSPVINQAKWLQRDLERANGRRRQSPWVVLIAHRPMYCSNDNDECADHHTRVRVGIPPLGIPGLEGVCARGGVDLILAGHEHSYERSRPVYDWRVRNPGRGDAAPVHITSGCAGNREGRQRFAEAAPDWSAFRSNDFGYGKLVANRTHLYFEQYSVDRHRVIDHVWMVKESFDSPVQIF